MKIICKFNYKLNQSGVTLVEMLIVMGLLSGMLIVVATIFTSAADEQQQSNSYSATISSGRFIMARLNYDISRASSVITPSSLGATSPSLSLDIGATTYTYSLNGNDFQLNDGSSTSNMNSGDVTVTSPSFQEIGNVGGKPTIIYSFTVTSNVAVHGTYDTQTFNSTAELF